MNQATLLALLKFVIEHSNAKPEAIDKLKAVVAANTPAYRAELKAEGVDVDALIAEAA